MSNINVLLSNRRNQVLINQAEATIKRLNDILDVEADSPQNGAFLVYNASTQTFQTTVLLNDQTIDGGTY